MIPRLHARGTSFKGAAAYLFHDKGQAKTAERVAWVHSLNLWTEKPQDAWFEMMDTWRERGALKKAAGLPATGRDNKQPVLHFSLSWHANDAPTAQQMKEAAQDALKALGLQDHQALIIAHRDEPHPHVHLLVNTVHRHTGKTASLSYSKETLSRWAEAYQLARGQEHCPERVKNNAQRAELKKERTAEKATRKQAQERGERVPPRKPYQPVKDRSLSRKEWMDKAQIVARMKEMHTAVSTLQKPERDALSFKHRQARIALFDQGRAAVSKVYAQAKADYRPIWRERYRQQREEARYVDRVAASHPFERAVYVFQNRDRLAGPGKRLSLAEMTGLILSPYRGSVPAEGEMTP
jgi:hypothetical protein